MSHELKVFGRPSSSNTQKVLWMLHEVGRSFELTLASARLGHGSQQLCEHTGGQPFGVVDTAEYKQLCPTRQIPTLQDGDLAVWESHTILRYLAEEYKPDLHLDNARGMAQCSPWLDWVLASSFNLGCNHHLVDEIARTLPEKRDYEVAAQAHRGYNERLALVEERLTASGGPFLAGDGRRFSVADVPVGAELTRWSCAMEAWSRDAAAGVAPPVPALPALPALREFFLQLQARPAFLQGCLAHERQHFGLQAAAGAVPLFGRTAEE